MWVDIGLTTSLSIHSWSILLWEDIGLTTTLSIHSWSILLWDDIGLTTTLSIHSWSILMWDDIGLTTTLSIHSWSILMWDLLNCVLYVWWRYAYLENLVYINTFFILHIQIYLLFYYTCININLLQNEAKKQKTCFYVIVFMHPSHQTWSEEIPSAYKYSL